MTADKSKIIEKYINALGRSVKIIRADGSETQATAVIERSWNSTRFHFEESSSKIGRYSDSYFYYIGPASLDILSFGREDYVIIDNEKYCFVQKESIKVSDKIQYYRGVLKKITEDEDVFSG